MPKKYDAVLFDLLTALLDSWTIWNKAAGSATKGALWRNAYLHKTYASGSYKPYITLVNEAAIEVGLTTSNVIALENSWHLLQAWNDVQQTILTLPSHVTLGVVTNCSEKLGQLAASNVGVSFSVVVTAERAGYYKPHTAPYTIALEELGTNASNTLFVAGSPFDVFGTTALGLDTYWHNRIGIAAPKNMPMPLAHERTMLPLLQYF